MTLVRGSKGHSRLQEDTSNRAWLGSAYATHMQAQHLPATLEHPSRRTAALNFDPAWKGSRASWIGL